MTEHAHAARMRRALELARRGAGMTRPNPLVGAVIVKDDVIIGEGWHEVYGGPHAEVNALRAAGDAARGATLYVTLEPCAHHGKTPPCADAVIAAGVQTVIIAAPDPNHTARGGAERLRAAGIKVIEDVERAEARRLNAAFFHAHEQRTAFVSLKLAQSLDGAIAERSGARTPITGPEARAITHRLRAQHDAVLIGIDTALVDDPLLTARDVPCHTQPVRVVLDSNARLPVGTQMVRTIDEAPVWLVCGDDVPAARTQELEQHGVRILRVARSARGLDLHAVRTALYDAGVASIFVEGGAAVATSFIEQQLVQRMHLFIAPVALGREAVRAFSDYAGLHGWAITDLERAGRDALLTLERPEAD